MNLQVFIREMQEKKELIVNGVNLHLYTENSDHMVVMGVIDYSCFLNILIFISKITGRAYCVDKDVLTKETGIDFIPSMAELRLEMWSRIRKKAAERGFTSSDRMLRLSSLELKKVEYLSYPDRVIASLLEELAAAAAA